MHQESGRGQAPPCRFSARFLAHLPAPRAHVAGEGAEGAGEARCNCPCGQVPAKARCAQQRPWDSAVRVPPWPREHHHTSRQRSHAPVVATQVCHRQRRDIFHQPHQKGPAGSPRVHFAVHAHGTRTDHRAGSGGG